MTAYADYTLSTFGTRCEVCAEVVLGMDSGELLEQLAPRMRTREGTRFNQTTLMRHLRNHDRRDLIERDMRRRGLVIP